MALLRFIILGYGNIGSRHAAILDQMPGASIVAIIDPDPRVPEAVTKLGSYPVYSSFQAGLADGIEADIVNVCTPNGYHYEHAWEALDAGFHVLVEKPVTLTVSACDALIQKASLVGRKLYAVLQNRYSPPAQWLHEVMSQQLLGSLFLAQVQCFWNRDKGYYDQSSWRGTAGEDGGPLYTQFSHFVDLLSWTLGPISLQEGCFYNFNHQEMTAFEDTGYLKLSLASGAPVWMAYSTSAYETNLESSITLLGEKGSIKIGGQYMDRLEHCRIKGYQEPELEDVNSPHDYGHAKGSAANHSHVLADLMQAVNGEAYKLADAREARPSIALIEAAYQIRDQKGV